MSVTLLIIFLALMALGVPIAVALGAASVIVMITMAHMPLTMVIQLMYTSMNSFVETSRVHSAYTICAASFSSTLSHSSGDEQFSA